MPEGPAARVGDNVAHPLPPVLTGGTGSPTVLIGGMPAWRGVGAAAAQALDQAKQVANAAIEAAQAATEAATGTPGEAAAVTAQQATQTASATSMAALISAAGAMADIHSCETLLPPNPHGVGVVTTGSQTVSINGMPACRLGDTIVESIGPPNSIALGEPTVVIGG